MKHTHITKSHHLIYFPANLLRIFRDMFIFMYICVKVCNRMNIISKKSLGKCISGLNFFMNENFYSLWIRNLHKHDIFLCFSKYIIYIIANRLALSMRRSNSLSYSILILINHSISKIYFFSKCQGFILY